MYGIQKKDQDTENDVNVAKRRCTSPFFHAEFLASPKLNADGALVSLFQLRAQDKKGIRDYRELFVF